MREESSIRQLDTWVWYSGETGAQQAECGDRLVMSARSTGVESDCQGLTSPGIRCLSVLLLQRWGRFLLENHLHAFQGRNMKAGGGWKHRRPWVFHRSLYYSVNPSSGLPWAPCKAPTLGLVASKDVVPLGARGHWGTWASVAAGCGLDQRARAQLCPPGSRHQSKKPSVQLHS